MAEPALSVVLACSDAFPSVRRTVRALLRQDCAARLELVLVTASRGALGPDETLLAGFHSWTCVELGSLPTIARANAAGVRAARAEVVALAEDHCYPQPGWATALLEAHRGPWVAVGPAVTNANPATPVSRADFLIGYGPWAAPCGRGERPFLPGHNSSYKRAALLALGDGLEEALEAETVLHFALRARGERLLLEPRARAAHLNIGRGATFLRLQFHNGRSFAAARLAGRGPLGRLGYAALWPLIPALRLARSLGHGWRTSTPTALAGTLPWLAAGLVLDGLGQAVGALGGEGNSRARIRAFEFRRTDHVPASDVAALERDA